MLSGGYWHIKEGVLGDGRGIKRSGTLALLCYAGGKVELFERQSASALRWRTSGICQCNPPPAVDVLRLEQPPFCMSSVFLPPLLIETIPALSGITAGSKYITKTGAYVQAVRSSVDVDCRSCLCCNAVDAAAQPLNEATGVVAVSSSVSLLACPTRLA